MPDTTPHQPTPAPAPTPALKPEQAPASAPEQTLADAIAANAAGPKKVQGDAGSVESHSLADQIAADRYLAAKRAVRGRGKGIVISKLIPPGAV